MVVDNRGDASHEGQTCGHVEVKMEGLAEPANKQTHAEEKGFWLAQSGRLKCITPVKRTITN